MLRAALLSATLLLAGCATAPAGPSSRAEWEAIHVRDFPKVSAKDLQDAAERVLRLADEDFTFEYPRNQLVASRPWMMFGGLTAVGGRDHWMVDTEETQDGTRATINITREMMAATATPVVGGPGVAPVAMSGPGVSLVQAAPYDLFWQRLDYMLGRRADWVTCEQFKKLAKAEFARLERTTINALCSVATNDHSPSEGPLP